MKIDVTQYFLTTDQKVSGLNPDGVTNDNQRLMSFVLIGLFFI